MRFIRDMMAGLLRLLQGRPAKGPGRFDVDRMLSEYDGMDTGNGPLCVEQTEETGMGKPKWSIVVKVGRKEHRMRYAFGVPDQCGTCSLNYICKGKYKNRDTELSGIVYDVCRVAGCGFEETTKENKDEQHKIHGRPVVQEGPQGVLADAGPGPSKGQPA